MQLLEDQTLTLTPCTRAELSQKPDSAAPPLAQHLSRPLDTSHQVERGPDPAWPSCRGIPYSMWV